MLRTARRYSPMTTTTETDARIRTAQLPNGRLILESGWELAGFGIHRDSDPLEESNYSVAMRILAELANVDPLDIGYIRRSWDYPFTDGDSPVAVARFGHWAVGWITELMVRSDHAELVAKALELAEYVAEQYPVLDDSHYAELEWNRNHPDDGECYSDDPDCGCGLNADD